MSDPTSEPMVRWLATLAGALTAAAIIGMASIIWSQAMRLAVLETKVDALQNQLERIDEASAG